VAAALAGDFRGPRARYQQWIGDLTRMNALAKKMRAHRRLRGSLDFDLPEAVVVLDEDNPRLVRDVRKSKADPEVRGAYQLVEEFMLAANEAVARFFTERDLDTVWRVHAKPNVERLEEFATLAAAYGIEIDPSKAQDSRVLSSALKDIEGKPFQKPLNFMLLRSMKQATYDVSNIGHFGLGAPDYLHFTSPIRRYPDLIVHRLLKFHLRKEGAASGGTSHPAPPPRDMMQAMAAESSGHERRAAEAEREVKDMYRAYLMRDRLGEELDGVVSGVMGFGLFIECDTPFVEGLIKTESLGGEGYQLDDKTMRLVGRRSGRAFALGDRVRVRVVNVSVARRRIDLELVAGGTPGDGKPLLRDEVKKAAGPKAEWGGKGRGVRRVQEQKKKDKERPRPGGGREADRRGGRPGRKKR
jgi:ribonuclease R